MIGQAQALADECTVMTADAGFHSHDNMRALYEAGIPALVQDCLDTLPVAPATSIDGLLAADAGARAHVAQRIAAQAPA